MLSQASIGQDEKDPVPEINNAETVVPDPMESESTGGGPQRVNAKINNAFKTYNKKEGKVQAQVVSMLEDANGNMWFGTFGGVTMYNPRLIGTGEATLTHYGVREGLSGISKKNCICI